MYLKRISGRSIKGGDFDIDLTQANVLTGDNFAGKTRVMDAIRLLLVGYLPELGKLPRATFELASGPSMTVRGDFDNGETIIRRWYLQGDTVKTEQELPKSQDGAEQLLTVMMNAEQYFALTDQQRVNYVFANCPIAGDMTRRGIVDRVVDAAPSYAFNEIDYEPELSLQDWIGEKIDEAADRWKAAKDAAKRMEETVRGLTALRAEDEKGRPIAAIEDDVTATELRLAELNDRKTELGGRVMAMQAGKLRRAEIARALAAAPGDRLIKTTLEEKLNTVTRELAAAALMPAWRGHEVGQVLQDLSNKATQLQSTRSHELEVRREISNKLHEAERYLAEIDHQDECPYCGAKGDGWKAQRSADLAAEIDKHKETIAASERVGLALKNDHEAAIKARDEAQAANGRIQKLKGEETTLLADISRVDQRLERVKALEEERDRLPFPDAELEATAETIQTELNVIKEKSRQLTAEIKTAIGRQHDLKRLADAEAGRDRALKDQALAGVAGKELRKIQGELVEAAFKPMLATANQIFGRVLQSPLGYREGEIGTWRGTNWVGHRTMSGTEKLLTYAAIQAALAAKSPTRIMIMDELGRIVKMRAGVVGVEILRAIDNGILEQFIGIDAERPEIYQNLLTAPEKVAFQIIPIG